MNTVNKSFDFSQMNVDSTQDMHGFRRENGYYKSLTLVALHDGEIKSFAEIRHYATKATNYCCVWIHSPVLGLYGQTGGKAGGFGYNRSESAFSSALAKMNIKTPGWADQRLFLGELANHLGLTVFSVIETNA